jgi:hypothetical protein
MDHIHNFDTFRKCSLSVSKRKWDNNMARNRVTELAQNRVQFQTLVLAMLNLQVLLHSTENKHFGSLFM